MTNPHDDAQIMRASALLKERIDAYMKRSQPASLRDAARLLGIPLSTLHDLLPPTAALPSPRSLKKLRAALPLSSEDVEKIGIAATRRRSLSKRRGAQALRHDRAPAQAEPAVAFSTADWSAVHARLARLEESIYGGTERLEAVTAPLPDHLTAGNFRPVNIGRWSAEKRAAFVRRANQLAIELRRSLAALAQFEPDDAREELRKALAENLDELWRHYKIAGALYPLRSVELIRLEGKLSEVLSSRTARTENAPH